MQIQMGPIDQVTVGKIFVCMFPWTERGEVRPLSEGVLIWVSLVHTKGK